MAHRPLDLDGAEIGMMNKIKENWRPLVVLATVVWAVFSFAEFGFDFYDEEETALIFGPFVIAMAIYFLFPKQE